MLSPAEPASSQHCETSVFVDEQEYIPVCVSVCTRGGGGVKDGNCTLIKLEYECSVGV